MKRLFTAVCLLGTVALTACGGGKEDGQPEKQAKEAPEPFTMTIYAAGVKAEEFDSRFRKALESKFPHITFKFRTSDKGSSIQELVAQGDIPDLIRTDIPSLKTSYIDLGLAYDLREQLNVHNYSTSRFNPVFVQEIVDVVKTGELYGLPVPPYFPQVLYYNKDLFDKFGQPYLKDGMRWDEVYELAKKLTRVDGDRIYRGFSAGTIALLRDNPYSQPILDPKADRLANPDVWKTLFENLKRFYDIPNNTIAKTAVEEGAVFGQGRVAMQVNQYSIYVNLPPELNWDIVSAPTMDGAPKLMPQRGPAYWSITKQSKYKSEAFQAIMTMLSEEVQMQDSRGGIPTTLASKEIAANLGKDHPVYSKKNTGAVNYYAPIPPTAKREAGLADVPLGTQQNLVANTFQKVATGEMDINTALNDVSERLRKEVEKEKSK
ncbi:extracellular solute-binding protein [Paenibacillus sp. GYB004]|uniref:ABC transporter substrate-binding protein n=1 Tax=Paenibacillus sp. GYB004 TaxID=2994393 RepID=UPI002F96292B